MNNKIKASLEKALDEWVDSECEEDDWIDASWPSNGTELLVNAACAVIDAFVAENKYIEDNVTPDA